MNGRMAVNPYVDCGHSKVVCRACGTVVAQCRCMNEDKRIEHVESCDKCRPPKTGAVIEGMSGLPYTRTTKDHRIFDPNNPPTKHTHAAIYDWLGAHQFRMLIHHGLRSFHRVLDVGCGSLCVGRLLIPWLDPGNYVGIEPDADLLEQGIDAQVGMELLAKREAKFFQLEDFKLSRLEARFNVVLAHSIFIHHGPAELRVLLQEAARCLLPTGHFLFTYRIGPKDFTGVVQRQRPISVRYRKETMAKMIREAGLKAEHLPAKHPTNQVWVKARLRGAS